MSLSLDISVAKTGRYDIPTNVMTGKKKSSVSMAVHTSCFSGISIWLHCNITSFVSLSVHSVNSTLAKKINLLLFRLTLPSPSFSHSFRTLSKPSLGNLQDDILEMSALWSEKINLRWWGFLQQFLCLCYIHSQLTITWCSPSCLFSFFYNYIVTSWGGTSFFFLCELY